MSAHSSRQHQRQAVGSAAVPRPQRSVRCHRSLHIQFFAPQECQAQLEAGAARRMPCCSLCQWAQQAVRIAAGAQLHSGAQAQGLRAAKKAWAAFQS